MLHSQNYTRYGHINKVFVKVGDKIKKGQKIATNGTGNGQWLAHLHRDHPKTFPLVNGYPKYTFYNIGWTKQRTMEYFADPTTYAKALGKGYDHLGYGWLTVAIYKGGKSYHPGLDENGKGIGNADYDAPVYAVTDGVVEYVYNGNGSNGGWGRLIIVKEKTITPPTTNIPKDHSRNTIVMEKSFKKFLQEKTGKDFGDNLNENEQREVVEILTEREQTITHNLHNEELKLREQLNYATSLVELKNREIDKKNDQLIEIANQRAEAHRELTECRAQREGDIDVNEIVGFIKAKDWKRAGWQIINIAMAVIAAAGGSVAFLDDAALAQIKDAVNTHTISAGLVIALLTAVAQFITKKLNAKK